MKKTKTNLFVTATIGITALILAMNSNPNKEKIGIKKSAIQTLDSSVSNQYSSITKLSEYKNIHNAQEAQLDNMVLFANIYQTAPDIRTNIEPYIKEYLDQSEFLLNDLREYQKFALHSEAKYLRAYQKNILRRVDILSTALSYGFYSPQVKSNLITSLNIKNP